MKSPERMFEEWVGDSIVFSLKNSSDLVAETAVMTRDEFESFCEKLKNEGSGAINNAIERFLFFVSGARVHLDRVFEATNVARFETLQEFIDYLNEEAERVRWPKIKKSPLIALVT